MARWIKPSRRYAIYARDRYKCVYCGHAGLPKGGGLHLDHLEPRTRFGGNESANLVTACGTCNRSKHGHGVHEWLRDRGLEKAHRDRVLQRVRRATSRKVDQSVGRAWAKLLRE